jgi:hypothetical protein
MRGVCHHYQLIEMGNRQLLFKQHRERLMLEILSKHYPRVMVVEVVVMVVVMEVVLVAEMILLVAAGLLEVRCRPHFRKDPLDFII